MTDTNEQARTEQKWRDTFPSWEKHHVNIPLVVLAREDLSLGAKCAYGLVRYLSWRNHNGEVEVSVEAAAGMLSVSKRGMDEYLSELRKAGLLTSIRRGLGKTNAYEVHPPPDTENPYDRDADSAHQEGPDSAHPHAGAPIDVKPKTSAVDKQVQETTAPAARKERKRDVAFDAMAEATGSDAALEGGRIAKAVNALRKHPDYLVMREEDGKDAADEALATAIKARAVRYRQVFKPDIALTPQALVNNWKRVLDMPERALTPDEVAAGDWR